VERRSIDSTRQFGSIDQHKLETAFTVAAVIGGVSQR
jgi:hypothetical protein